MSTDVDKRYAYELISIIFKDNIFITTLHILQRANICQHKVTKNIHVLRIIHVL
jgi:hypothetical protein